MVDYLGDRIVKFAIRLIQISFVSVFITVSVEAQSSDDLRSKYGAPFEAFEIRPGIMMTVKFDENSQASEIRIERHAATDSKVYLDTTIPSDLSKEIVDELVPVAERGAKGKFSGLMLIVGGSGTSLDDYENVSIIYHTSQSKECSGLIAIVIKWKNRVPHQW
jgi:hypothetical protein